MKVCLLNDSFPPIIDGVANVVMNYAKIMQEEKLAEVVVGTPKYPGADYTGYPYSVYPYKSINTSKIANGYRAGNPFDIAEITELVEFKPDIIHTHCPIVSAVVARLLRKKVDVPLIFTYHTKFDEDIAKAVKAKFIQKETVKGIVDNISACDEVWVVSNGAGENLRSLGYEGEYRVVNNGVDFEKGRVDAEQVEKVVAGYDLPKDVPMFLFVGRIVTYKGIPLILETLAKLAATGQDFRMVFVGGGPDEDDMKKMAAEYGLLRDEENKDGKCMFIGPVHDRNDLRAWNTRADLFLFPSTYDTNGIVVREAAACGLASILIKDSCAAEGITHARNGYMIDKNAESFCAMLSELCKNIDAVHTVGQNAMDEIYISWADSVHEAHKRYGEIIEMKKNGTLKPRKPLHSDVFFNLAMSVMGGTEKMIELPQKIYGMYENVEEKLSSNRIFEELHRTLK